MIFRNNKGMALPLVLIVMLVATLLTTAILQFSVAELTHVSKTEKKMQAHYLARSGADAMAGHLIRNPSQVTSIAAKTSPTQMATGTIAPGKDFYLDVTGSPSDGVTISAKSSYDGITATSDLILEPVSAASIFRYVISSRQNLDVSRMKQVVGNLESRGSITRRHGVNPGDSPNSPIYYPSPIIPLLPSGGHLNIRNNQRVTLTESRFFSTINMAPNAHLEFRTQGNVLRIVVDTFTAKGNVTVNVVGGGRLELYITGRADFQTPLVVNDSDPNSLFIFLRDGIHLNISANGVINGYIYGPNSNVGIQSAHTTIKGAVIANSVSKSNNNASPSNGNVIFHPVSERIGNLDGVIILRRKLWRD